MVWYDVGMSYVLRLCYKGLDVTKILFIYDKQDMDNVEDDFIRDILAQLLN